MYEEHHVVFRQNESVGRELFTIDMVEHEMKLGRTREDVKAGGLVCSRGSAMTFVRGVKRKSHFRHIPPNHPSNASGPGHAVHCGCSDEHIRAQSLLRDHDYDQHPILFTEWLDCKKHTRTAYKAAGKPDIRIEEKEDGHGRSFVSDLTYSEHGVTVMRVEVWKTHRADPVSRMDVQYVEVRADHVIGTLSEAPPYTLRCEPLDNKPCADCTPQYDEPDILFSSDCDSDTDALPVVKQTTGIDMRRFFGGGAATSHIETDKAGGAALSSDRAAQQSEIAVRRANTMARGATHCSEKAARATEKAKLACIRIIAHVASISAKKAAHHAEQAARAAEKTKLACIRIIVHGATISAKKAAHHAEQAAQSADRAHSTIQWEETHNYLRSEYARLSKWRGSELASAYRLYAADFVNTVSVPTHSMDVNELVFFQSLFENTTRPMAMAARKLCPMDRRTILNALNVMSARIRQKSFLRSMPEMIRPHGLCSNDTIQADADALYGDLGACLST